MDENLIIKCCKLAWAAYSPTLPQVPFNKLEDGLVYHTKLYDQRTSTEGYIAVNSKLKSIYVVFKGTKDVKDVLIDAKFLMEQLDEHRPEMYIHIGFKEATMSILDQLKAFNFSQYPDYEVYFVGHSLGAAVATLCCYLFDVGRKPHLITFGSPKVGNKLFASTCDTVTKESVRVVHNTDIVPLFLWYPYKHVRSEWVHIDDDGNLLDKSFLLKHFIYWLKGRCKFGFFTDHKPKHYLECLMKWEQKTKGVASVEIS